MDIEDIAPTAGRRGLFGRRIASKRSTRRPAPPEFAPQTSLSASPLVQQITERYRGVGEGRSPSEASMSSVGSSYAGGAARSRGSSVCSSASQSSLGSLSDFVLASPAGVQFGYQAAGQAHSEERSCVVCLMAPPDHLVTPCNHLCLCSRCAAAHRSSGSVLKRPLSTAAQPLLVTSILHTACPGLDCCTHLAAGVLLTLASQCAPFAEGGCKPQNASTYRSWTTGTCLLPALLWAQCDVLCIRFLVKVCFLAGGMQQLPCDHAA